MQILDISKYQGVLTDQAVKIIKDRGAGVIMRMGFTGYGSLKPSLDECFEPNYKKLTAAGVPVGCYYFTIAYTKAMADLEISFIKERMAGKVFQLPLYIDCEGQKNCVEWTRLKGAERADLMAYIMGALEEAGNYVGIYSSKHGFSSDWLDMSKLTKFDKWVAQWGKACTYSGQYNMWQYTSSEPAADWGITKSDRVDMSISYVDFPAILKAKHLNGNKERKSVKCPKCGEVIYLDD